MVQGLLGVPKMLPGSPRGQNCFYSKTKTAFAFFILSWLVQRALPRAVWRVMSRQAACRRGYEDPAVFYEARQSQ